MTRAEHPSAEGALSRFFRSDVAGSWVLVLAVGIALLWANGPWWSTTYASVWLHPVHVGGRAFQDFATVRDWVNGGLMAVFFLVVGLEIGRERRHGDLADTRTAVVPVAGALGGMAGAGLVYAAVTHGGPGASGWGIPMATDIAFALGALALLGRRVPPGLRVVLLTLAVADDIGSVVVLAVFYSSRTFAPALAGGGAGRLVPGVARAGTGRPDRTQTADPAAALETRVAPWSAFLVLPLFAVANAGITFHRGILAPPGATAVFAGVALARVVGKLAGITLACLLVVRLGLGRLPDGVRWRHVAGGAAVAGIGFTVPLLIAELAFLHDPPLVTAAELGLFAGSTLAFAVGAAILWWAGPGGPEAQVAPREEDDGPRILW